MRKIIYLTLITHLLFTACSKKPQNEPERFEFDHFESFDAFVDYWKLRPYLNACPTVTDAFTFPDATLLSPVTIPDEMARSMSAYGLLETLFSHPRAIFGPWFFATGSSLNGRFARFNDSLRVSNVAVELFKRADCFSALASAYLNAIKEPEKNSLHNYLEILIASDMSMLALNEREKILAVAMAFERNKLEDILDIAGIDDTWEILVNIMQSLNYQPFMREFKEGWEDFAWGYVIFPHEKKVISYIKQFLNEYKNKIHETH